MVMTIEVFLNTVKNSVVNGGMISGLLPVVGVPLPLVSYGGTSIVSLLAAFGVIMSIYSHRKFLKDPR